MAIFLQCAKLIVRYLFKDGDITLVPNDVVKTGPRPGHKPLEADVLHNEMAVWAAKKMKRRKGLKPL